MTDDIELRARAVRVAIFDVDGVMTDGTLYLDDAGIETKGFSVLDGHGLRMLADTGVRIAILTGRRSRCVELRAANLGIELVWQGVADKRAGFAEILSTTGVSAEAASYMGDDVVDVPVLRRCGFALSVPGAHALARENAHHVTQAQAGRGAVREVCELIMRAQGTLEPRLQAYLA
jgi:3-deoxy-D-manno-octulosonate 8-phosphate phosphatase (KDO 8-P phosphatase)